LPVLFRPLFLVEISAGLRKSGSQRLVFAIAGGELFRDLIKFPLRSVQFGRVRIALLLRQPFLCREAVCGLFQLLLEIVQLQARLGALRTSITQFVTQPG
jgi:hypothetical protein